MNLLDELKAYTDDLVSNAKSKKSSSAQKFALGLPAYLSHLTNNILGKFDEGGNINALMKGGTGSSQGDAVAALDAAGIMQTGALPFAPRGAGIVGTIRKPQDIVKTSLAWNKDEARPMRDVIGKAYTNYLNKRWNTPQDEFIKAIDDGIELAFQTPESGYSPLGFNNVFGNITKLLKVPKITGRNIDPLLYTVNTLQRGEPLSKAKRAYIDNTQHLADLIRTQLGGQQIAKTSAGKYFENQQDMDAFQSLQFSKKFLKASKLGSRYPDSEFEDPTSFLPQLLKNVQDINTSDYYKKNKNNINVFMPDVFGTIGRPAYNISRAIQHMADVVPYNDRMSLLDTLLHTKNVDKKAYEAAQKAQDNLKLKDYKPIVEYDDGLKWVNISSKEALAEEGKMQGHCVGSYCDKVARGTAEIYSLRNKETNRPLYTLEWDPRTNNVVQIKGRFNSDITRDDYDKYVSGFIDSFLDKTKRK